MSLQNNKYFSRLIPVIILLMLSSKIAAQLVIIEPNQSSKPVLQKEATWFFDKTGTLSFDEIRDSAFAAYNKLEFPVSKKQWANWARLELSNLSGFDQECLLQTNKWGFLEAFIISGNAAINHSVSGSLLPLQRRSQRSRQHKQILTR